MPQAPTVTHHPAIDGDPPNSEEALRVQMRPAGPTAGRSSVWHILLRRWRLLLGIEAALLLVCSVYCRFWPQQYEAAATVEMRTAPATSLTAAASGLFASASSLAGSTALETAAGLLRSDQLAAQVITELKLGQAPGFRGSFSRRFPGVRPDEPTPEAQAWLLDLFSERLTVETLPRTLLIQVRFRSRNPALSAAVVAALLHAYDLEEEQNQATATAQASNGLGTQLTDLKRQLDRDEKRLADFQAVHGIVTTSGSGIAQPGATQHDATGLEIDELSRQLVDARSQRLLAQADYQAALQGDPELVIATDSRLQAQTSLFALGVLQQIYARRSDLEQEQAKLSAEFGPGFPRVVEIGRQLQDLDRQRRSEDTRLVERFRRNWQTALDRESLVSKSLQQVTAQGLEANRAQAEYAEMRQEANASREVYLKLLQRMKEAGLTAATGGSNLIVVDAPRPPVKPVSPDPLLDLAITFFVGLWVGLAAVLLRDRLDRRSAPAGLISSLVLAVALGSGGMAHTQAPTPSTSGLPTGVANLPQTPEVRSTPSPHEAPPAWSNGLSSESAGLPPSASPLSALPMPAPIAAGDLIEVTEAHLPDFRTTARVSPAGTVTLPLVGEVRIDGMDELGAAHAIESVLTAKGMLLHPLVSVLVTGYAGQDVSVLGEVARPGVYPFAYHHRLLDLIAAASGLSANAGRLVNVFPAKDPRTSHPVVLDPNGSDPAGDHNPELHPGDTVQVSRAGLVYVVGDVIRPGGFPVDPVQRLTVVQAVSLAWGPTMNASLGKAVLIREQKGGRTLTTLDLKRLLHGQDPDQPVQDRDIIYVPDSTAKNLLNRTLESAIQSTVGVTIYSGLVYSQRF